MIQPEDVAEICLLPFRLSVACVPSEVTLRRDCARICIHINSTIPVAHLYLNE